MKVLGLDFETYYDREYSLTKLSTEEYVRDRRFEAIAVCLHDSESTRVAMGGDITELLHSIDWSQIILVAHNAAFDAFILSERYGIHPAYVLCTQRMATALGLTAKAGGGSLDRLSEYYRANGGQIAAKGTYVAQMLGVRNCDMSQLMRDEYAEYCKTDAVNCLALLNWMLPSMPTAELASMSATIQCSTSPRLILDRAVLEAEAIRATEEAQRLISQACTDMSVIRSNDKFAAALIGLGVDPPRKISKPTKKYPEGRETWAFAKTDENFTDMLGHPDPRVAAMVEARLEGKSSIASTRAGSLAAMAARGTMPFPLLYYGAHTGRLSAGGVAKINAQNFPRNGYIKKGIRAPDGHVILQGDSSQIEARVLAVIAGQADLVQEFRDKKDVYSLFATGLFKREVNKKTVGERFLGKKIVLGCGYGVGGERAGSQIRSDARNDNIELPPDIDWPGAVQYYRTRYHKIPEFWRACNRALEAMFNGFEGGIDQLGLLKVVSENRILLPNGMHLRYPRLVRTRTDMGWQYQYQSFKYRNFETKRIYGAALTENICQALARIIVAEQWLRVNKIGRKQFGYDYNLVVGQVHDSLILTCPERDWEPVQQMLNEQMHIAPSWASDWPIAAEVSETPAYTYGDA